MNVRVVVRDTRSERSVELPVEIQKGDLDFLNELGERIAQETGWGIVLVAIEESA